MSQSPAEAEKPAVEPKAPAEPWTPTECDVVWSRFDKSKAQALGLILKLPTSEALEQGTPSVYCDVERNDRFCVALLHNEAHVYPPRYYLTPFHQKKAEGLKCMRAKLNSLTPWDKIKRRAIKDIIAWKKKAHNLEDSHDFTKCANCCDEATDEFWKRIGLTRGQAHIEQKEELDKAKRKAIEEANLREQKVKAREEKLAAAKNAEGDTKGEKVDKAATEAETKKESESGSEGASNEEDEETDDEDNGSEEDDEEDEDEESSSDVSFSDPEDREESEGEAKASGGGAKKGAGRRGGGKRRLSLTSGKESETETDSGGENATRAKVQVRKKKKGAAAATAAAGEGA